MKNFLTKIFEFLKNIFQNIFSFLKESFSEGKAKPAEEDKRADGEMPVEEDKPKL